jgi:hypothetical protein
MHAHESQPSPTYARSITYEADVDTGVLRLSPEFLAALRGIAPPKRRRVIPYLFVVALAVVAGALGFEGRTREFLFAEWQRLVPSALAAPSIEAPRVGSTVVAPSSSAATAEPADSAGHAAKPEVIDFPPTEVPPAASEEIPPWKSAGKTNRNKARAKVGSGRR